MNEVKKMFESISLLAPEQVAEIVGENEKLDHEKDMIVEQSNYSANIPRRFAKTRIGDFSVPFWDEVKDLSLTKSSSALLVVSGPSGTGKTTFLTALMHERAINGVGAGEYLVSHIVVPMIRSSRSFAAKESEFDIIQKYAKLPLVVFDELGASEDPKLEASFFRTVFTLRYDNMLDTYVGTNLDVAGFKEFVAMGNNITKDPIIDRMNDVIRFKKLVSESHRGAKA